MYSLGERLKNARQKQGMLQCDLAAAVGIGQTTVANYERNFREPELKILMKIADVLEVSMDYLTGRAEEIEFWTETLAHRIAVNNTSYCLADIDQEFVRVTEEYMQALLSGNGNQASALLMALTGRGTGIKEIYLRVLEPGLKKLGDLWNVGEVTIAQERFCTNFILRNMALLMEQARLSQLRLSKNNKVSKMHKGQREHVDDTTRYINNARIKAGIIRVMQDDGYGEKVSENKTKMFKSIWLNTDGKVIGNRIGGKSAVAATIGCELHEVGLRMVSDFLELNGWNINYLGANLPSIGIFEALARTNSNLLLLSATLPEQVDVIGSFIKVLRGKREFRKVKILVGGQGFLKNNSRRELVGADGFASTAEESVSEAFRLVKKV